MIALSTMERAVVKAMAIPAQSIRDASRNMTPEDAEMFRICIRAMDRVFLRHQNGGADPEPTMTARDSFRAAFKK
ncbi:MAG: hypothetical protein M0R28_20155 [Pigmentiphaga sp.]|nr:hypothetical protein [Pigmentiphaga sp.]